MNGFTTTIPWKTRPFAKRFAQNSLLPFLGETTFNNSYYVNMLNCALRLELDSLSHLTSGEKILDFVGIRQVMENHNQSIESLSSLIVRNSGIPISHSSFASTFSSVIIRVKSNVPGRRAKFSLLSGLCSQEKKLEHVYQRLLLMSPSCDRFVVLSLRERISINESIYSRLIENNPLKV
ncbi:MAG: hypothetical protein R3B45_09295 [Bdellovibrionota bacterium]